MNQRKAGTILSYLHIILNNTISLIYTPYMLRIMGQSEYGLYGTASSIISYLSVLGFGIGGAYIRFNAKYRATNDQEGEKRLNGMFLSVFSVLSMLVLAGGLICIAFAGKLVEDTFTSEELYKLRVIMLILTLNMVVTFVFNVVTMALQAYEKYICIRLGLLVCGVVTPVINVIALNMGGRAVSIALISFLVSLGCYIVYFIYARKAIKLEFIFSGFQRDVLKEIFVFSGFLFLNTITDQITFSTDNVVLSATRGTTAVAVYTVGSHFKSYFHQFSTTVATVFSPSVNLMVLKNQGMEALNEIFVRVGRVQFYIVSLIMIGYLSIGHSFVRLWAGADYSDAFYVGLFLMLAVFVPAFQNVGLEIQKAMNKHRARSIAYFLVALINVGMTIPFSRWWGGIGAALATTICMFCGTVLFMNFYYRKYIGLDIPGFWRSIFSILPGYILPAVVGFLVNRYWAMDSYLDILCSAMVISTVFLISIWLFSMNEYERNLLRAPIRKLMKK